MPLPGIVVADVTGHLASYVPYSDDALIFTSPDGAPLRHSNFHRRIWLPALATADLTGVHVHDLRHAGNTYTANAGASLRELMARMGHSTSRAALIYQHSTDQRQRILADAVDKTARAELRQARRMPPKATRPARDGRASGTDVARDRRQTS